MAGQNEQSIENPLKVSVNPQDPNLLTFIKEKFLDPAITGEDNNKLLLFLICFSCVTDNPLSAIVKGPSGTGKSHLANRVLDVFRKTGRVIEFSRITPAYLENMAKKDPSHKVDLTGKILFIDELRGIQSSQAPKLLISEGRLRLGTVSENRQSVEVEVKGTPTIITTTTQPALEDPEFENRVIPIQIDETEDQTRAVIEHTAESFMDVEPLSEDYRLQGLADYLNSLKPYKVKNPFASLIAKDYPIKNIEARRDFKKLLALSNVITLLYQRQRRAAKKGIDIVLVTDLADVEKVRSLGLAALRESLAGLSEKEEKLLDVAKEAVEEKVSHGQSGLSESGGTKSEYKPLSVKDFVQGTRKTVRHGKSWIRERIKRMAEEGYLEPVEQTNPPYTWRYAQLQPESLQIQTDKYSNTILSTWAEAYGFELFDADRTTPQVHAQPDPNPVTEPISRAHSESTQEIPASLSFVRGQPVNEPVVTHAPESLEKDLCRATFEKNYRRIKGVLILASSPVAASCEDCGRPSEIRVRINP